MRSGAETVEVEVLRREPSLLGEGATYDRTNDTAWWFDIIGKTLFEHRFASGKTRSHELPWMASQLSFIDDDWQLLAADTGLFRRRIADGALFRHAPLEEDDATTRSNDGRTHASGALWIGTMALDERKGGGSIYWFRDGELRRLYANVTIPNAICFAPDGATAYFTDTFDGRLLRVLVDPRTGLPQGEPAVLFDANDEPGGDAGLDGAVTDADGLVWVARWGGAEITVFTPAGDIVRRIAVPARQATCPAFVGPNLDRLLVTTASKGLTDEALADDPSAGATFVMAVGARGREDPRVAA